ncbi:histidine kinase dimerization/phosphoacceptor domain -containing protein [Sphingomonas metalli]|uniref:histidine kinase dimerization/phosphoacceptor domain -containing protein n=1 Tax=Sphingomonas metalli TaxID=1779358 RepID=UPI001E442058|nr:histidine kinase dimerization/phosphoacceptor domain -containing protein [Sphingomonas metalli]
MPGPGLDQTGCDREPIHIPGSIQPHGLLLIAEAASHRVAAAAGDVEGRLTPDWLGGDLSDLLGQSVPALLEGVMIGPGGTVIGVPVTVDGQRWDVALHRSGEYLIAELEPAAADPPTAGAMMSRLELIAQQFERATDLQGLCERAAIVFRGLTGFDRVMIYRFLDDDAGRVVAEDRDPALGAFLHHHFPASDIPRQARALYVRNRTRAIPDVEYEPAPIRPAELAGIDLSDVGLRSVSPIHVQYLRNMGVGASASISIVKDGLLWGLIACHHDSPRLLPADIRQAAALLATSLARQIRAKEEAEAYRERLRLRSAEDGLALRLADGPALESAVERTAPELRALLGGDGFALVTPRRVITDGDCPPEDRLRDLAMRARGQVAADPFATHEAGAVWPDLTGAFAGVLALPLIEGDATLLWLRVEQVTEVEWAGNPHKAVPATPGATLTPRASFATWTEAVRGRARRWTLEEVEAARRLRRAFEDARRTRELRDVNAVLTRTLADKDALLVQKDVLMKEVDHRVQNSLQLVGAFLSMQARAAGPGALAEQLGEAQARLSAVALVHRRLYRDDQIGTVDLSRYLDELIADMKASFGGDWAAQMRVDLAPVLIQTDRAVNVGLIMTELVINATKYAYAGAPGPIAIALEQHRNRLRLIVADEGTGKHGDNSGFGSRMMAAMVARLDGEIAFLDNTPGLRAILTAPILAD